MYKVKVHVPYRWYDTCGMCYRYFSHFDIFNMKQRTTPNEPFSTCDYNKQSITAIIYIYMYIYIHIYIIKWKTKYLYNDDKKEIIYKLNLCHFFSLFVFFHPLRLYLFFSVFSSRSNNSSSIIQQFPIINPFYVIITIYVPFSFPSNVCIVGSLYIYYVWLWHHE